MLHNNIQLFLCAKTTRILFFLFVLFFANNQTIMAQKCAGVTMPFISQTQYTLDASAGSSYQWYLNGKAIPGATQQSYFPLVAGDYYVIVIDKNGCNQGKSQTAHTEVDFVHSCPLIHNYFGFPCDDGDAKTVNDRVRNNCKCRGDYASTLIKVKCPKDTVLVSTSKYGTVFNFDEFNMFKSVAGPCAGMLNVKRTSGYYTGYPFEPSAFIQEEYIATDMCGNKSSCSFFVTTTPAPKKQAGGSGGGGTSSFSINTLSPNPAQNKLTITIVNEQNFASGETELRIFNTLGQTILIEKRDLNIGINEINLDINYLQNGLYFVSTSDKSQVPMKFVKE